MKKAQATMTDLIMSAAVFIVLSAFILFYWTSATTRLEKLSSYEETQLKAIRIADELTKTPGNPTKWETIPNSQIDSIHSLGLATKDRILSDRKIFNLTRIPYDDLKELLNIEGYDFNITIKTKDDLLALLKKYDIRIAYIAVGPHCSQGYLETQLITLFSCQDVNNIDNRNEDRCEMYRNTAELVNPSPAFLPAVPSTDFDIFKNISSYDLVVMENPTISITPGGSSRPTWEDGESIRNFTKKGGFFLVTEKIYSNNWFAFGADSVIDTGQSGELFVTSEYYAARDSGDEKFVNFDGDAGSPLQLPQGENYYIFPAANTTFFTPFYRIVSPGVPPKNHAARWELEKGRVYYFNSGCNTIISKEVGVAARKIVQHLAASLYSNIINSGIAPPNNVDVVTIQRDVLFNNKSAIFEFTLWKQT